MAMTCHSHWDTTSKNINTYVPTYGHAETRNFCDSNDSKSCLTHAPALTQLVNLATSPLFIRPIRTSNAGELRTRQWFLETQTGTCYNVSCGVVGFEPCAVWAPSRSRPAVAQRHCPAVVQRHCLAMGSTKSPRAPAWHLIWAHVAPYSGPGGTLFGLMWHLVRALLATYSAPELIIFEARSLHVTI